MTLIVILSIVAVVVLVAVIFITTSPEFGGKHNEERMARYRKSVNFKEGIFHNERETNMDMDFGTMMSVLKDYITGVPNSSPKEKLSAKSVDSLVVSQPNDSLKITWLGHSAFLIETGRYNILIDPMLGAVPAPHPWLGRSRFSELPITVEELPEIDFVLFSHDHYDHLDYGSVRKLKGKVKKFFVPLGLGAHLETWGVPSDNIEELEWWNDTKYDDIKLTLAPARHFSGRGLNNRFSTLWGSWIIKTDSLNIYFSGDSGYDDHFSRIGEKYGPFDFAMLECGQYDERWSEIHMFPEETAQAAVDLKAKAFMPIHWGSFVLALHTWTDPIERVTKKAEELNAHIVTPEIGEPIIISAEGYPQSEWWKQY